MRFRFYAMGNYVHFLNAVKISWFYTLLTLSLNLLTEITVDVLHDFIAIAELVFFFLNQKICKSSTFHLCAAKILPLIECFLLKIIEKMILCFIVYALSQLDMFGIIFISVGNNCSINSAEFLQNIYIWRFKWERKHRKI